MLIPEESTIWANLEFRRKNEAIAAERAAAERSLRAQEREQQRSKYDDDDPIDVFNQRHTISDMMLKYGYERKGRSDSYRSPMQSSGSFATKDFGTHWVSLSGSDRASGIGQASGEFCYGDAFDIWAHFEHGGRMSDAVREYGKEIRPTPAKQREEIVKAATDPYADFDTVPDPEPQTVQPKATIIIPNAEQKPIFWLKDAEPVLTSSYLIKGWLGRGQMSVVYGPSNVGKSFFCLDMALCVSASVDWQGSKVKGGPVLYLATEGGNAFQSRCVALRKQYGIFDAPLAVRPSPVDLLRPEADMAGLIELCKQIEADTGEPLAMIVIDTLSRAMAGGDENGPTDMTSFIANADALRDVTGAHIMIVHHSGKDTAKGARGHSSLRAATDTEIELEVEDKMRTATATKQRDLEPQDPFVFTLKVHELGKDEDGDAVTTCTIDQADPDDVADMQQKRPSGANQKIVTSAFKQLRGEGIGGSNPTGPGWPESGKFWCIEEVELRKFALGKLTSTNPSSAYNGAIKALLGSGYMVQNEGQIWISAKEGRIT
jgi:RecA-family ATPase